MVQIRSNATIDINRVDATAHHHSHNYATAVDNIGALSAILQGIRNDLEAMTVKQRIVGALTGTTRAIHDDLKTGAVMLEGYKEDRDRSLKKAMAHHRPSGRVRTSIGINEGSEITIKAAGRPYKVWKEPYQSW